MDKKDCPRYNPKTHKLVRIISMSVDDAGILEEEKSIRYESVAGKVCPECHVGLLQYETLCDSFDGKLKCTNCMFRCNNLQQIEE